MPRRRQPSSSTDKKTSSSATFRLVHRSQTDPLIVDQSAPEYVLQPTNRNARMIQESSKGHSDESTIRLPSNMFESDEKLPVGLLNMQAERSLDLSNFDEDVAEVDAALDGGKSSIVADIDLAELDDALPDLIAEDDDASSVSTLTPDHEVEETRSRFTEYSLTSSVIRRNAGLTLIDERFEKLYEEYDEEQLGSLELEDDVAGQLPSDNPNLLELASEFWSDYKPWRKKRSQPVSREEPCGAAGCQEDNEEDESSDDSSSDEEEPVERIVISESQRDWDCLSVASSLSRSSNNQPQVIPIAKQRKPVVQPIALTRSGVPKEALPTKLTRRALRQWVLQENDGGNSRTDANDTQSTTSSRASTTMSTSAARPKDETTEERRERKRLVKEQRRERRQERQANRKAFSEEKVRQQRSLAVVNNAIRAKKI